jgi:hypothetical protein
LEESERARDREVKLSTQHEAELRRLRAEQAAEAKQRDTELAAQRDRDNAFRRKLLWALGAFAAFLAVAGCIALLVIFWPAAGATLAGLIVSVLLPLLIHAAVLCMAWRVFVPEPVRDLVHAAAKRLIAAGGTVARMVGWRRFCQFLVCLYFLSYVVDVRWFFVELARGCWSLVAWTLPAGPFVPPANATSERAL